MTKVGLISLGCSKNLVDSEVMLGILAENGCEYTNDPKKADVLIVNTCSFVKDAVKESEDTIREFSRSKKPFQKLIVTGCLVQKEKEKLVKKFPKADAFLGVSEFTRIADVLKRVPKNKLIVSKPGYIYDADTPRVITTPLHSVYIKISEGCDNRCNYCSIPSIRGGLRSRKIRSIIKEAENLALIGAKEINIISQDTTNYGKDIYGKPALVPLLKELEKIKGIKWIRLLYLYPSRVSDVLLELIRKSRKILPYFDIPLQHIDGDMLKMMGRKYNEAEARELIGKIRKKLPDAVLRTTFITGHPEETEEAFNKLLEFVKTVKFDRLGVFAYSPEKGTKSYSFGMNVPVKIRNKRKNAVMKAQQKISFELNKSKIGSKIEVLVESAAKNRLIGRSKADAPDIDGRVYATCVGDPVKPGDILKIRIKKAGPYDIYGEKEQVKK